MKLNILYEQVVGHWRVAKGPYEFYGDPKNKRQTDDLSFRIKGKREPIGGSDFTELEDIAYGLAAGYELRPNLKRIEAVRKAMKTDKNPVLKEIYDIWVSGHGVLPKKDRIKSMSQYLTEPHGGADKTQRLETGARPIPNPGRIRKIGMEGPSGNPRGGKDESKKKKEMLRSRKTKKKTNN